jgi:hypothetical protein
VIITLFPFAVIEGYKIMVASAEQVHVWISISFMKNYLTVYAKMEEEQKCLSPLYLVFFQFLKFNHLATKLNSMKTQP